MKKTITVILFFTALNSQANTDMRQKKYAELIDGELFSQCISRSWRYNRKTWFGATFIYSKTILLKKWLVDDFDDLIEGSLESIIQRIGISEATSGVHRSEESAVKECETRMLQKKYSANTKEEINAAIERFLNN